MTDHALRVRSIAARLGAIGEEVRALRDESFDPDLLGAYGKLWEARRLLDHYEQRLP